MSKDKLKIVIILIFILLLEIPLFVLWNNYSGLLEKRTEETIPVTAAVETATTEAPTVPVSETTVSETVPETTEAVTEPPKITIDEVPQYFQNSYPDEPYLTTNVANSGSSMTALAMVASYMTDHAYYPDEMADWLAHFMGSNYERLEYGNDLLQLNWKRAENIHEAVQAVQNGKVVILMLHPDNLLTWKEHYVVLTGINDQGNIMLLDTDSDHYEKEWLKEYYEKGLQWEAFLRGYSCAWIYDKSQMPEEPFVYAPEPPAETPRYGDLKLTSDERYLIARLICMEAGGEPFEGQQAVAEVILNRLHSGDFQSSIHNIIHAPGQFASLPYLEEAEPDYTQYKAIEQALYGPSVLPEDVVFFATYKVNDNFWGMIGSHYFCRGY